MAPRSWNRPSHRPGRQPDVVMVTHAGGGNFTGTARGMLKSGYTGKLCGVSVDLKDLDSHDDSQFARKSFSHRSHRLWLYFSARAGECRCSLKRGNRYTYRDAYYTVTQGDVYYITELLDRMEGLQRGPAGNTSLAGAFALARQMDEDQIIVVQESEYTGAGKSHTAQLTFAEDHGVKVYRGDTSEENPGESIVIPEAPQDIRIREIDPGRYPQTVSGDQRQEQRIRQYHTGRIRFPCCRNPPEPGKDKRRTG